jgi:glycerol-3-phosphate dehydrogenase
MTTRTNPPPHSTSLNAIRRAAELDGLAAGEVVDVLVVGGGVTGAGVALDAASRGLSVALLEAHDLAFGTSRWSSKLVHGGLRYLASGEFGLAHECAVERGVLMTRTAPHLARALPQLVPRYAGDAHPAMSRRKTMQVAAGMRTGDLLRRAARTRASVLPAPRRARLAETVALVPGLRRGGLIGGLLYFDGQLTDDAALVVALARTAAGYGARVITRARVRRLSGDGAIATDTMTGDAVTIRARSVINAAGVWAAELVDGIALTPSRGSHLVLDAEAVGIGGTGLNVPVPGQPNRYLLMLPAAGGRVYLGLTDEPVSGPVPDVPTVPEHDVDFLLGAASTVLARPLTRDDVRGSFAGLRPLLAAPGGDAGHPVGEPHPVGEYAPAGGRAAPAGGRSADLSRRHAVLTSPDGVITVVGGKLTTYRRMAADAVDAAIAAAGLVAGPCRTRDLPLVGAAPRAALDRLSAPARLIARYGTETPRLLAMVDDDPALAATVGIGVTAAEVVWAVHHEGALNADDVLDRRTRIGLVPADRAAAEAAVSDLLTRAGAASGR